MNTVEVGARFGRWAVVGPAEPKIYGSKSLPTWQCVCDCGTERAVTAFSLRQGSSSSCGCLNRERSRAVHTKHGGSASAPEYDVWQAMLARCRNPQNPRFAKYGGRGIKVCDSWLDYGAFIADMGPRPTLAHSLDRIDNDGGYEPGNCRWATPHQQMTNRSVTRMVEIEGQSVPLATLAKLCGIPANTLRFRILKGWPLVDAMTKPVRAKARAVIPD